MRVFTGLALLFLFSLCASARNGMMCEIKQFFGTDSANSMTVKIEKYNLRGQLISEEYKGWHDTDQDLIPDGTTTYFYNDTLLILRIHVDAEGDSSRTEYLYNDKKQLTEQNQFSKSAVRKSGPGQVYIGNADPLAGKWNQISRIKYTYDAKGRKVVYDATQLHFSSQNMYKWEYDDKNRVVKHESYSRGKLTWREDYHYFEGGYRMWRIWYDEEGNPRHENKESYSYWPLMFFTYTFDKQGKLTEMKITDEQKNTHGRTVYFYNTESKPVRTVWYNHEQVPRITHIYTYTY